MSRPKKMFVAAEKAIREWAPVLLLADYDYRVEDHLNKSHNDAGTIVTSIWDRVQKICDIGLWKGLTARAVESAMVHELIHGILIDLEAPLEPNTAPCEAVCNRFAEIFIRLERET